MVFFAAIHLAFLGFGGANSGDLVVAATGWLLVVLLFAGDIPFKRLLKNAEPPRANLQLPAVCGGDSPKSDVQSRQSDMDQLPPMHGTERTAAIAGLILLGLGLAQTCRVPGFDLWFFKIQSFILLGGILLLSCGWRGLFSQWRLAAILFVVAAPETCLEFVNRGGALVLAQTRIAGFVLHSLGFELTIRETVISLPTGNVEVQEACSGLILMLLLLKIALMVSIAFPVRRLLRVMICAAALLTGFAAGVVRIAVLAAIVHRRDWFEQLHGPVGMSLFPMLGFLIYAPFLLPMEKPLVLLLQKIRANWRSAPQEAVKRGRYILAGAIGMAFGICLLKGLWIKPPSSYLQPDTTVGFGTANCMKSCPVPPDLSASRFNAVHEAWRAETGNTFCGGPGVGFEKGPVKGTEIICSMSWALRGPDEIIRDPKIAHFLDGQFGRRIFAPPVREYRIQRNFSTDINCPVHAEALIQGEFVRITAVNAEGDTFFTSSEYASAQRATLFRWLTWKDFLMTGRPLKDLRYRLIVEVSGKNNG
jgi:exosortase/archaeosortase family protein